MEKSRILFYATQGAEYECRELRKRLEETPNSEYLKESLKAQEKTLQELTHLHVKEIKKKLAREEKLEQERA